MESKVPFDPIFRTIRCAREEGGRGWIIGKGDTRLSNCVHGGLRLDLLPGGISLLRDVYYSKLLGNRVWERLRLMNRVIEA